MHWGSAGAAGLLLRHTDQNGTARYLLQHRSGPVQHPARGASPGGALQRGESPLHAALREASEEMGDLPVKVMVEHVFTEDHGGWSYSVVLGEVAERFHTRPGPEQRGTGWFTRAEMRELPLFPGSSETFDSVLQETT